MIYLLDTNPCVRFLNGRGTGVIRRLSAISDLDVAVCSVVKAELFSGALRSADPARTLARQVAFLNRFRSLPFDDRAAEEYGRIHAELTVAGTLIGPNDLTLVTHNTREFSRVNGLRLEDWEAP